MAAPVSGSGAPPEFFQKGLTIACSPGSRIPLPLEKSTVGSTTRICGCAAHDTTGSTIPLDAGEPQLPVTVTFSVTVPDEPEVNTMVLVPAPEVIVPLPIVHA